jgi:hypothetical protein
MMKVCLCDRAIFYHFHPDRNGAACRQTKDEQTQGDFFEEVILLEYPPFFREEHVRCL